VAKVIWLLKAVGTHHLRQQTRILDLAVLRDIADGDLAVS
jgi:hypothetical protein